MVKRYVSLLLVAVMITVLATPIPSLAQSPTGAGAGLVVPVDGVAKGGGRVTGTFTILKFVDTGDATNPVGALGTLVVATANGRTAVTQVTMPVSLSGGAA